MGLTESEKAYRLRNRERQLEFNRQYRIRNSVILAEKRRARSKERSYPCPKCGTLIGAQAKRCRACWYKEERPKGEQSVRWKGGIIHSTYTLLYMPTHPQANQHGYIAEHRWVWEQQNNKPVPKGWIVHHLNGIRTDNRPANLVAMPAGKHNIILRAKAKRIQELEAFLNSQHQLL